MRKQCSSGSGVTVQFGADSVFKNFGISINPLLLQKHKGFRRLLQVENLSATELWKHRKTQ
jgi:hypothetical protein